MKKILFGTSVIGLILGLIVHIISIYGINLQKSSQLVWFLHLGVFLVFFPAILELRKNDDLKGAENWKNNSKNFLKIALKNKPKWLLPTITFFMVYAMINFIWFMISSQGVVAGIIDGEYVLHNHGKIIKKITEVEYNKFEAKTLRGFSGHWMVFYSVAMGILFPKK